MKIYHLFAVVIMAFVIGCEPKEDREDEGWGKVDNTQLNFNVTQDAQGGNIAYLSCERDNGALIYWDYVTGVSKKEKDTVYYRFAGDYWVKYSLFTKDGLLIDSSKVSVAKNDTVFFKDPRWNLITNGREGKTWVWAYGNPYNALTGIGPLKINVKSWKNTNLSSGFSWWGYNYFQSKDTLSMIAVKDCEIGELTFDLNGGTHMKKSLYKSHKDSTVVSSTSGFFTIDTVKNELTLTGVKILKQEPDGGKFQIVKLTEDELVLGQVAPGNWRPFYFKRKGYKFPNAPKMIFPE